MFKLAYILRALQLYTWNIHNLTKGPSFFGDHCATGEFYEQVGMDYDSVIERAIGIGDESVKVDEIAVKAGQLVGKLPHNTPDMNSYFKAILDLEEIVCAEVEKIKDNYSEGTKQLIGEICNKSEMRQYKIKQRLK